MEAKIALVVSRAIFYDHYGRLTSRTDTRGVSVSYSDDTLSRVTAVTYPTGVNSYSYAR